MALREALVPAYGGRVADQDRNHFDEAGQVRLRPDIVWKIRGSAVAVIDAKYKAEKPAGYPNADLYQLLAYCTVLGLRNGHLVYAKGNEDPHATSCAAPASRSSAMPLISAKNRGNCWPRCGTGRTDRGHSASARAVATLLAPA